MATQEQRLGLQIETLLLGAEVEKAGRTGQKCTINRISPSQRSPFSLQTMQSKSIQSLEFSF